MRKKGMLLAEETLKIVIAVISIGFLVYFLISLYSSNKGSLKSEQAEASLAELIEQTKLEGVSEVQILSPINPINKWDIISWPNTIKEGMPNSCANLEWENCICICKKISVDNCDAKGFCAESEFFVQAGHIEIKNPPVNLIIDRERKTITRIG